MVLKSGVSGFTAERRCVDLSDVFEFSTKQASLKCLLKSELRTRSKQIKAKYLQTGKKKGGTCDDTESSLNSIGEEGETI